MLIKEQYLELVALAQIYLTHEFPSKTWLKTDIENYLFFKSTAKPTKNTAAAPIRNAISHEAQPSLKKELVQPREEKKPLLQTTASKQPAVEKKHLEQEPKQNQRSEKIKNIDSSLPVPERNINLSDIKTLMEQKVPSIKLLDHPSQEQAAVILIYDKESSKHLPFLTAVGKAIHDLKITTKVVSVEDIEQQWNTPAFLKSLSLLMLPKSTLEASSALKQKYRHADPKHFIMDVPVLLLEELALYQQDPGKKKVLWSQIKATLLHNSP